MAREDIETELRADNPAAKQVAIALLADQLRVYAEAAGNVERNGAIVAHPRTNAPIENPYLRVMQATSREILKARAIRADRVFAMLRASVSAKTEG